MQCPHCDEEFTVEDVKRADRIRQLQKDSRYIALFDKYYKRDLIAWVVSISILIIGVKAFGFDSAWFGIPVILSLILLMKTWVGGKMRLIAERRAFIRDHM